jgi:hypothetical protein
MNYIVAYLLVCFDMNYNDDYLEGKKIFYKYFNKDTEVIDNERDENVYYIFIYIMYNL